MDVRQYLEFWDDDFGFVPRPSSRRLSGRAGSQERVAELARRVEVGEDLWSGGGENVVDTYIDDYDWILLRDQFETQVVTRCRRWQYRRWRYWGNEGRSLCFIGLRPSETQWRRQLAVAKRLKFDGCESVNLYSWALSSSPHDGSSEVGAACDSHISQAVMASTYTVICWGEGGYRGEYVAHAVKNRVGVEGVRFFGLDDYGNPLPVGMGVSGLMKIREYFNDDDGGKHG